MSHRFHTLYGKPRRLTDRYDECSDEVIARVFGKPEAQLGGNDFNLLFRVGVAPASYEEGLWFLPAAFAFLRRPSNPGAVGGKFQKRGFVQALPEVLAPEPVELERHAGVVRSSGDLFVKHPTYWRDLFRKLGLESELPGG